MHFVRPLFPAAALAALTIAFAGGASAATTTAPARPTGLPDAPDVRNGDYRVLNIGQKAIEAKCAEGGTVAVATHPAPKAMVAPTPGGSRVHGVSAERDAAIRSACKAVDYTK